MKPFRVLSRDQIRLVVELTTTTDTKLASVFRDVQDKTNYRVFDGTDPTTIQDTNRRDVTTYILKAMYDERAQPIILQSFGVR